MRTKCSVMFPIEFKDGFFYGLVLIVRVGILGRFVKFMRRVYRYSLSGISGWINNVMKLCSLRLVNCFVSYTLEVLSEMVRWSFKMESVNCWPLVDSCGFVRLLCDRYKRGLCKLCE